MKLNPECAVGNIVAEDSSLAQLFERLDIDYFCGGRRSLADALKDRGISFEELLSEWDQAARDAMAAPAGNGRWRVVSLRELIRHILSTHHAYLHREMPELERWAAGHPSIEEGGFPGLWQVLNRLRLEMEVHIRKEETILFPAIEEMEAAVASGVRPRALPFGSVSNFSLVLEREHRQCAVLLQEIHHLIRNHPHAPEAPGETPRIIQRLQTLIADTHYHIHLENNILFARAIELEKN